MCGSPVQFRTGVDGRGVNKMRLCCKPALLGVLVVSREVVEGGGGGGGLDVK